MSDLKALSETEHIIFIKDFILSDPSESGIHDIGTNNRLISQSNSRVSIRIELYQKYHQLILNADFEMISQTNRNIQV